MTLGDLSSALSFDSVMSELSEVWGTNLSYLERTFGVRKGHWGQALATLK